MTKFLHTAKRFGVSLLLTASVATGAIASQPLTSAHAMHSGDSFYNCVYGGGNVMECAYWVAFL